MVVEYCGGGCCWYSDVGAKERVVVVFVVACLLVLIGLVYLCVSTRKNDLEFVEMVEIIPSVPV